MTARYLDLSDAAIGRLGERLRQFVGAAAIELRDEIVAEMEEAPPRTGRRYPIPGTTTPRVEGGQELFGKFYTASAPGEPPAIREGRYRDSWKFTPAVVIGRTVRASAYTDLKTEDGEHVLGELLEYGTSDIVNFRVRMEPRPHVEPALARYRERLRRDVARHGPFR